MFFVNESPAPKARNVKKDNLPIGEPIKAIPCFIELSDSCNCLKNVSMFLCCLPSNLCSKVSPTLLFAFHASCAFLNAI